MKSDLRLSLSIRQRLTLFTCALLLSVILVFGLISYIGVRKAALEMGLDRLQNLTNQFSAMLSVNRKALIASTVAAANMQAVKAYLASKGKDSASEVLRLLEDIMRKDTTTVVVELRISSQVALMKSGKSGIETRVNYDSILGGPGKADSGRFEKLYAIDSSVYHPIIATVIEKRKVIGYLVRWRKMVALTKTLEQFSQMLGKDFKLLVGNDDGRLWADMRTPVALPQLTNKTKGILEYRRSNQTVFAYVRPFASGPGLVAIELSKKEILEASNRYLYWLLITGLIILVIGISIAWFMSRMLSEPLRKLTEAATAIESGNYSTPVQVNRRDELGKLARAFNAMEVQVQRSRKVLELKAEEYRLLFEDNPMPMWIINKNALNVIDVNKAAERHYGYTKEEFLKLNAMDLRPAEDIPKYLEWVRQNRQEGNRLGILRHKKKDGTVIMVDVIADNLNYQGQAARLILANDITAKLKAESELISYRIQQQKLITETTIQVQEKEREEIGKELHDNINQLLAAAKISLDLGMKRNGTAELFMKSSESISLAIQEIRRLSKNLVAPPLEDITLPEAIKEVIDDMSVASGIKVDLDVENYDEQKLEDNIKLMVYRIVQEQVNNILKHSLAKNVSIELSTTTENTILKIKDNGIGFDPGKVRKGIGLRNITNRAKFYNGSAEVISVQGKGTQLEVTIPVKQAEEAG